LHSSSCKLSYFHFACETSREKKKRKKEVVVEGGPTPQGFYVICLIFRYRSAKGEEKYYFRAGRKYLFSKSPLAAKKGKKKKKKERKEGKGALQNFIEAPPIETLS